MYTVFKKNFGYYLVLLALFIPGFYLYWKTTRMSLDVTVVVIHLATMFTATLLAIFNAELIEERSRGYRFLASLPVTSMQIVAGKFLPILISTVIYVVFSWMIFSNLEVSEEDLALSRKVLVLSSPFSLMAGALSYIGIFRFGFARFNKILLVFLVLSYLSPVVIEEAVIPAVGIGAAEAAQILAEVNVPVFVGVGMAVWILLAMLTVKVKEKKYEITS